MSDVINHEEQLPLEDMSFEDLRYKGNLSLNKQDYHEALIYFTKALEQNTDHPFAYLNKALAHDMLGEYEKAIEDYTKAIENDPTYFNRAFCYYQLGEYEKAIEGNTKAIERDPNNASAYFNRACCYFNLGEYEKAIEDLTKAIELDLNNASAYFDRASCYYQLGEYEKAIKDYTICLDRNPVSKELYSKRPVASVYLNRGICNHWIKEYDKAVEDYTKVIKLDPYSERAQRANIELDKLIPVLQHESNKVEEKTNSKSEDFKAIVGIFLLILGLIAFTLLRFRIFKIWIN